MQRGDKLDFAKRSLIAILSFSISGFAEFFRTRQGITPRWYPLFPMAVVLFAIIGLAFLVWAISSMLLAAKGRSRRNLTVIVVIAILGLLLLDPFSRLLLTYPAKAIREHIRRIPFDSVAWQDLRQVEGRDPVRLRMVDDLVKSRRLDHLSRSEVQMLLGKHTERDYGRELQGLRDRILARSSTRPDEYR